MYADEAIFAAQAEAHESLVADNDALDPQQFVERERRASGLADCPAPALNAILRRSFAFDDVAGLCILEQKEGGCAGEQIARHAAHDLARAFGQIPRDKFLDRRRPGNEGAKGGRSRKIIPDTVAR
ncbi:MAG: hypothetical protein WAL59_30690 [Roseiarcus sp.]